MKILTSRLFIVVTSIFFTFILAELVLQFINYPYNQCPNKYIPSLAPEAKFGHFDQDLGWDYNPNTEYIFNDSQLYFDEHGFRVQSATSQIDFSKPRLLFIGGSVTFGHGLNYEETFASKIGQLLNDQFEVVNLGVQGYGTDQTLIKLQKYINLIKPSIIVYTFIPDHLNRNVNFNRSSIFNCLVFPGTKPLFGLNNNRLVLEKNPINSSTYTRIKTSLVIKNALNRFREIRAIKTGFNLKLTEKIIDEIEFVASQHQADTYYIYYEEKEGSGKGNLFQYHLNNLNQIFAQNSKSVLEFIDFVEDPTQKYFLSQEDQHHPSSYTTSLIANQFVSKFGDEILTKLYSFPLSSTR
jgi:hypothetical protein